VGDEEKQPRWAFPFGVSNAASSCWRGIAAPPTSSMASPRPSEFSTQEIVPYRFDTPFMGFLAPQDYLHQSLPCKVFSPESCTPFFQCPYRFRHCCPSAPLPWPFGRLEYDRTAPPVSWLTPLGFVPLRRLQSGESTYHRDCLTRIRSASRLSRTS